MENLIHDISDRIFKVQNLFANCTERDLSLKELPDKWSKKEILGHLVDSAQNNIRRIVIGQYIENENIVYDQNTWVKAADYQHYNTSDLVELFVLLNKHFCVLLKNLPKDKYQILTNWGKALPDFVSLEYMAHDYLRHMEHHIAQMNFNNY